MERKIGEVFEYNGEWYQCIINDSCRCDCDYCDFGRLGDCNIIACTSGERKDGKEVYFKKLEKVGEPYEYYVSKKGIIQVQDYLLADPNHTVYNKIEGVYDYLDGKVVIEIKQTNEDMEENKLNLKPFDIQKAREGKPVCTRDGRKARIICFDLKDENYPIVAAIRDNTFEDEHSETLSCYSIKGETIINEEWDKDLMMLCEKKEGWINIYKGDDKRVAIISNAYATKEEALNKIVEVLEATYITTTKIEWEE